MKLLLVLISILTWSSVLGFLPFCGKYSYCFPFIPNNCDNVSKIEKQDLTCQFHGFFSSCCKPDFTVDEEWKEQLDKTCSGTK
uniref:Uncharacterized protein n=1 Tax=Strigamia maritima TaxID=126957 RepID=T1IQ16_STRMM